MTQQTYDSSSYVAGSAAATSPTALSAGPRSIVLLLEACAVTATRSLHIPSPSGASSASGCMNWMYFSRAQSPASAAGASIVRSRSR